MSEVRVKELWAILLLKVRPGQERKVVAALAQELSEAGLPASVFKCLGYYDVAAIAAYGEVEKVRRNLLLGTTGAYVQDLEMLTGYQFAHVASPTQDRAQHSPFLFLTDIELNERAKHRLGLKCELHAVDVIGRRLGVKKPIRSLDHWSTLGGLGSDLFLLQYGSSLGPLINSVLKLSREKDFKRTTSLVLISYDAIDSGACDCDPDGWDRHVEIHIRAAQGAQKDMLDACNRLLDECRAAYIAACRVKHPLLKNRRPQEFRFGLMYELGERDFILILHGDLISIARYIIELRSLPCCEAADTATGVYHRASESGENEALSGSKYPQTTATELLRKYRAVQRIIEEYEHVKVEEVASGKAIMIHYKNLDGDVRELLHECRQTLEYALRRATSNESHPLSYALAARQLASLSDIALERFVKNRPQNDEEYFQMRNERQLLLNALNAVRFSLEQRHSESGIVNVMATEPPSSEAVGGVQKVLLAIDGLLHHVFNLSSPRSQIPLTVVAGWRHVPEYVGYGVVNLQRSKLVFSEDWTPLFHECGHAWVGSGSYPFDNDGKILKRMASVYDNVSGNYIEDRYQETILAEESEQIVADLYALCFGFRGAYEAYERCYWKHILPRVDFNHVRSNSVHYLLRGFFTWLYSSDNYGLSAEAARRLIPDYVGRLEKALQPDLYPLRDVSLSSRRRIVVDFTKVFIDYYPLFQLHARTFNGLTSHAIKRMNSADELVPPEEIREWLDAGRIGRLLEALEARRADIGYVLAILAFERAFSDPVAHVLLREPENRQRVSATLLCYHYALKQFSSIRDAKSVDSPVDSRKDGGKRRR